MSERKISKFFEVKVSFGGFAKKIIHNYLEKQPNLLLRTLLQHGHLSLKDSSRSYSPRSLDQRSARCTFCRTMATTVVWPRKREKFTHPCPFLFVHNSISHSRGIQRFVSGNICSADLTRLRYSDLIPVKIRDFFGETSPGTFATRGLVNSYCLRRDKYTL